MRLFCPWRVKRMEQQEVGSVSSALECCTIVVEAGCGVVVEIRRRFRQSM